MYLNKILRWTIIVSVCYSALVILMLHFWQPDKSPIVNAISEYVDGEKGGLMTSVFFVQSIGSLALAILVLGLRPRQRKLLIGGILFVLAALGDVIAGSFQADPITTETMTETGMLHTFGGITRFIALAVALPLLSSALRKLGPWQIHSGTLKILGILFVVAFVTTLFVLAPMGIFGLGQRVFIAIVLTWMLLVALPKG